MTSITITHDGAVDASYVRLSPNAVTETIEFSDDIFVDLDEHGVVVGVEVLSSDAPLPFDRLEKECHVHSSAIALLRAIRPSIGVFLMVKSEPAGTSGAPHAANLGRNDLTHA